MEIKLEGETLNCKKCHEPFWSGKGSGHLKCRNCRLGLKVTMKDAMDKANNFRKKKI